MSNYYLTHTGAQLDEAIRKALSGELNVPLQEKTVTPTTSKQVVTPDTAYKGLSQVTVNAIPQSYTDEIYNSGYTTGYEEAMTSRLPDGYIELEYIESSGTQYINSGVDGKSGLEVYATWMYTNASYKRAIIGCLGNSIRTYPMHHSASNYGHAYQSWVASSLVMEINTVYNLYTKLYSGEQVLIVNGETVATGSKTGEYNSECPMYIFALYNEGSASNTSSARLYGMQIYDNGTLIRDFVPCVNPDFAYGLYDRVNSQFYPNDGTGTFKGNIVVSERTSTYTVEAVSGASYGFSLISSGYYESTNKGVNSSYALCRVNFDLLSDATVYFDCINYAESNYDYGLIGKLDTALGLNTSADSSVTKNFKGSSSSSVQTVSMSMTAGTHFVDVKFIKDGSTHNNNDSLQFKVRIA